MDQLNNNELEALRIIWDEGKRKSELKPAEIQAAFQWEIDNGTLRSTLVNLVQKELLSRRKIGKAYFYKTRTRKNTQFGKVMKRVAEVFTGGSKAGLIMELLKQEDLDPEDLATLQKIAQQKINEQN